MPGPHPQDLKEPHPVKMDLKSAIAQVKGAYDLADYLRGEGHTLLPAGVGKWKTICVFHNDTSPSLMISESFQNYKCWACGASGDLLSFAMEQENLSFSEAIRKLAEAKGLEVELSDQESSVDYSSLEAIARHAARFYCREFNRLPDDHVAKEEISKRGLTWDNAAKEHIRYGFAPGGSHLLEHLKKLGYSEDLIVQAGLARERDGKYFDFFRSRLIMIFTNRFGKPVGFTSRKLYEDDRLGKYVNSPEGPLFKKSSILYNHEYARAGAGKRKSIYIAEGQFDVAAIYESGIPGVVAASGTAFTREHAAECRRMAGPGGRLIFCFDGDEAGQKAAARVFTSLPEIHEDAYVVVLPSGQDPCDYRLEHGSEALVEYLQKQVPLVEFMVRQTKKKYSLDSVVERAKYVEEAASIVKTVTNLTLRENCIKLLALEGLTPLDTVRAAVAAAKPMRLAEEGPRSPRGISEVPLEEGEESEEEPQEELSPEEVALRTLKDLEDRIARDPHYALTARFFSLGLTRSSWREALTRSENLTPREFHPVIEDLVRLRGQERIFPELFENTEVAKFLMERDFSGFYKFMDLEELKEQFIYLHKRLQESKRALLIQRKQERVKEILMSDSETSLELFQELLEKASS